MKITVNFICIYSRVKKNGLVPIYCVLKKGTEINRFSTKQSIQKNLWDASKNRAKGKTDEAILVNEQLESMSKKLNQQLIQLYNKGGQITIIDLLEVYFQKTAKHPVCPEPLRFVESERHRPPLLAPVLGNIFVRAQSSALLHEGSFLRIPSVRA